MLAKIVLNIIAVALLLPVVLHAQADEEFQLSHYRWENRLLLIFAPSQKSADYKKQLEELQGREDGMLDRDLKTFRLFTEETSIGDGHEINKEIVESLYRKFDVQPGSFAIILIGKDGTEKLRKESLLNTGKLFGLIDSMPMRQREMRDDGQ